jgi:hypothetical protein
MIVIEKQNFNFIIFILFLNILSIIKTATTEYEMDRICSLATFNESEHKSGYRTIQHYVDDGDIELSKAHKFYRTLFFEGKIGNFNIFINSIILELLILVFGVVAFFNYFVFLCVWAGHCGIFKKLTDEEKAEKQSHCKYCSFFIMITIFIISLALNFFGILFIASFQKAIYLSDCALLRFTNHGLFGTEHEYAGVQNLRDAFINLTYSLKMMDTFNSRLFPYYNEMNTDNNDLSNLMDQCNTMATDPKICTPNPDLDLFTLMKVNYQPIYGPKTDESTMIGKINKKYTDKIKPIINTFTEIKNNFATLTANKDDYISHLSEYDKYLDAMTMMYEILNTHIVKTYNSYTDSGKMISKIALAAYYIFPILIIVLLIFIIIYICKKETTIIVKKMRIIIHILWNVIFIFSALSLILSCYIGTYRKYSYNLIPSFNHILSTNIIKNKSSEDNLFSEIADNSNIKRSLDLFNLCYNSSQSTNLALIFGIQDSIVLNFGKLSQNYNKLLKYVYHNNLNEDLTAFLNEKKNNLDSYLINITMTTSSQTHHENDISLFIKRLNQYTDFSNEDPYQIDCITNTFDNWVMNKDDCSSGYIYSIDGSQSKNCLLLRDWTKVDYDIRYLPTCKIKEEKGGGSIRDKAGIYLDRFNIYYTQNERLIQDMENGVDQLITLHDQLLEKISLEMANDNNTFLNFTLPFSMFLNNHDINQLFDCGLLKDDLIDFYDFTRNKLGLNSIIHMVVLLLISIFNVIGVYFLIRILYIFNRTPYEEDLGQEEEDENDVPEINDKKMKKNKGSKIKEKYMTDKEMLSVNKSKKNKNEKMSNRSKKTAPGKVGDIKKGTKSKVYLGLSKNKGSSEDETPSSSEKMRSKSSESEENETDENEKNKDKKNNKKNKKEEVKDSETSNDNEESEIESGIRDDGSAMS